jgi:hypothetical protein
MNGSLNPGEYAVAQYAGLMLRIEQREGHRRIRVYDSKSSRPNRSVWEGESYDIEEAIDMAVQAARGYLADPEIPTLIWRKVAAYSNAN